MVKILLPPFLFSFAAAQICSWGEWCSFSECDAPCGEIATQLRSRACECPDGYSGEQDCPGGMAAMFEEQECTGPCPECEDCGNDCPSNCNNLSGLKTADANLECNWSDWSEPTGCSNPVCGNGPLDVQTRSRSCDCSDGIERPESCQGEGEEFTPCPTESCCTEGDWTPWSDCTGSCQSDDDVPTRSRNRDCVKLRRDSFKKYIFPIQLFDFFSK